MPSNVERIPVQTPTPEQPTQALSVVPVVVAPQVSDFMPRVVYQVQGAEISTEAQQIKEALRSFLEVNQEILLNGANMADPEAVEQFIKGYRNAIAMVEFWVDSQYITSMK